MCKNLSLDLKGPAWASAGEKKHTREVLYSLTSFCVLQQMCPTASNELATHIGTGTCQWPPPLHVSSAIPGTGIFPLELGSSERDLSPFPPQWYCRSWGWQPNSPSGMGFLPKHCQLSHIPNFLACWLGQAVAQLTWRSKHFSQPALPIWSSEWEASLFVIN